MISTTRRVVHLVDPDETTLKSISFLLRELGYIVNGYGSLDDILRARDSVDEGCILLDLPLPGVNDLNGSDWQRSLGIGLPVIVLSGNGDVATAVEVLKGGASDFIERPFRKPVLLNALDAAFVKPASNSAADGAEEARRRLEALTPREWDVLHGLARGCSNKVIAFELGISPRTVEIHRARMMKKLSVRNLSHALRLAFAVGLETQTRRSAAVTGAP